jgi:glucosamine 6-phosphate synthetase-like amidotransferase/phosphosugar isomerase protein
LFAERWLVNSQAFTNRAGRSPNLNEYSGFIQFNYNSHGNVKLDDLTAITLHTRLATSGKGLLNCHPFIENDTSVIHNGVISNAFDHRIEQSTCDSESILTQYVDNKVGDDYELFTKASSQLDGYYACGIFSRDRDGGRILDVVKSSSAQLVASYVDELQCVVFTSLEYQLKEGLNACGFKHNAVYTVNPSSLVRIDPIKNKVIGVTSFEEYERSFIKLVEKEEQEEKTQVKKGTKKRKSDNYPRSTYNTPKWRWGNDEYDVEKDPYYYNPNGSWENGEFILREAKKGGK